jgi:hypothetical protein
MLELTSVGTAATVVVGAASGAWLASATGTAPVFPGVSPIVGLRRHRRS